MNQKILMLGASFKTFCQLITLGMLFVLPQMLYAQTPEEQETATGNGWSQPVNCSGSQRDARELQRITNDEYAALQGAWANRGTAAARPYVERYAARFAANAVLLPSGAPPITGRSNIQALWESVFASSAAPYIAQRANTIKFACSREMAYTIGLYTATSTNPDGSQVVIPAKYLIVWRKQTDGRWLKETMSLNNDQ